jgi:hypothetical protein
MTEPGYMVVLTEHDSGWGSKVFHAKKYSTYTEAKMHADEVNAENDKPSAPDYYITAEIITDPEMFQYYEKYM